MMVLITYDIADEDDSAKRLRRISKHCLDYGIRVQYSVFECEVTPEQWVELKHKLLGAYSPDKDSLRFYMLGANWRRRVEHHGAKRATDLFGDILIVD